LATWVFLGFFDRPTWVFWGRVATLKADTLSQALEDAGFYAHIKREHTRLQSSKPTDKLRQVTGNVFKIFENLHSLTAL
jgi:hypothetical protein